METWTIGVEEEFFVVDAQTRELRPRAEQLFDAVRSRLGEQVALEINLAQIETGTPVTDSLPDLAEHLHRLRTAVADGAAAVGSRVVAAGTHPFSDWRGQQITPRPRYADLDETFQLLAWEQLVSGLHVHVGVSDPDLAIAIMDRTRPWLATITALAANSPFWMGVDSGYASYRTELFDRWPTAGLPPALGDRAGFDALVAELVATDMVPDATKIYWAVRPSARFSTLEFRLADVCRTVPETVAVAGLCRALVRTARREVDACAPPCERSPELLKAARWRAARYGLGGTLIDCGARRARPAAEVVETLLRHLRADLEARGEWDTIAETVRAIVRDGTGADRQRVVFDRRGDLRDVVDACTL